MTIDATNDAELLRAYAESRSETAFAGFVGRRVGFVYATALRETGGDAHLSQDVAQAVFSLAAKRAGALAGHERLAGWLYTTTTRMARHERRDAQTRARYEERAAIMNALQADEYVGGANVGDGGGGAGDVGDAGKLRPLLNDALDGLREDERESVLLRFFEERSFGEIGARLKMSEDAARMRVSRAIEKMRVAFARRGVTSSASALGALLAAEAAQAAPAGLAASVSSGAISAAGAAGVGAGVLTGAGAAAAVTDVLIFMSTTKTMMIAAAVAVLAVGGAFYGTHSERVAERSLADAKREKSLLVSRARVAEEQMKTAQAKEEEANSSLAWEDRFARGEAFLNAYPKVRQSLNAIAKAWAATKLYRLRGELGMTDEQWEEFLRIRGVTGNTVFSERRPGMGQYSGMALPLLAADDKNWSEEMRTFLGDAGYARFQEEENFGFPRSDGLAAALWFTDTPLSAGQAKQLDELFSRWDKENKTSLQPEDDNVWNAFLAQASEFLSAPQIEALNNKRAVDAWQKEQNEGTSKLREEMKTKSSGGRPNEQ